MSRARKVMLLGEIGVGKSSLARRLVFDKFSREYKPTIGVEVYRYDISSEALAESKAREPNALTEPMSLILWDTDGNFGDAIFRHVYIKQAAAAVIVGDQSRPDTIDSMLRLARGFAEVLPGRAIHFVLNKDDLVDHAAAADAEGRLTAPQIAELGPIPSIKTSAMSGAQVEQVFIATAKAILRRGH
jgi:Ras-related protein Rab-5C